MAEHEIAMGLGNPDADCRQSTLNTELTMTNDKRQLCMVHPSPSGADVACEMAVVIPPNYVGTPRVVMTGVIEGAPANNLRVMAEQVAVGESGAVDVAYEAADVTTVSSWGGYANGDLIQVTVTLTPSGAYNPGETIFFRCGRQDGASSSAINLLVLNWSFRYADA